MKIDKRNPQHLKALSISATYSLAVSIIRPVVKRTKKKSQKTIVFYGHTLNGNLKAFFDYLHKKRGYNPYFLALDQKYFDRLKKSSEHPDSILYALNFSDMVKVGSADAFISSHGLHLFSILRALTNIKFIDVWHGVSYKGFSREGFQHLHPHDQIWVTTKHLRKIYIKRFGFKPHKVKITGYARTDQLVNDSLDKKKIVATYSIPKAKKYVLIAPTWKQDDRGRSILPFGLSEREFFTGLEKIAAKNSAHIIFRSHLNSEEEIDTSNLKHISFMPYSKYEVVEEFLFIADVLVTDWSSIGIDYLVLKKPTIFLDVTPPFKHGFELGPEHRYGDIAYNYSDLIKYLETNLNDPKTFFKKHRKQIQFTTEVAYGNTLDGKSVERYFNNLKAILRPHQ
jgi:CDP-glycerol glycerophosphotransferase